MKVIFDTDHLPPSQSKRILEILDENKVNYVTEFDLKKELNKLTVNGTKKVNSAEFVLALMHIAKSDIKDKISYVKEFIFRHTHVVPSARVLSESRAKSHLELMDVIDPNALIKTVLIEDKRSPFYTIRDIPVVQKNISNLARKDADLFIDIHATTSDNLNTLDGIVPAIVADIKVGLNNYYQTHNNLKSLIRYLTDSPAKVRLKSAVAKMEIAKQFEKISMEHFPFPESFLTTKEVESFNRQLSKLVLDKYMKKEAKHVVIKFLTWSMRPAEFEEFMFEFKIGGK